MPTVEGMAKEDAPYSGFLYAGLMIAEALRAARVAVDLTGKRQSPLVGGLTWVGCRILSMIL
jgi:hypothetical protein